MILIGVLLAARGSNTFYSIDNKSLEWINWRLTLKHMWWAARISSGTGVQNVVESRLIQMKLSIRRKAPANVLWAIWNSLSWITARSCEKVDIIHASAGRSRSMSEEVVGVG